MSDNIEGKVVVITGASSGLGEATARALAAQGASVVLGARRGRPFARLVAALRVRLRAAHARRATARELSAMSDGELADIGICRCDVNSRPRSGVRAGLPMRGVAATSDVGAAFMNVDIPKRSQRSAGATGVWYIL